MLQTMDTTDRVVWALAGIVIAGLYFSGQISGIAVIVLSIIAVAMLATGVAGFCWAYISRLKYRLGVNPDCISARSRPACVCEKTNTTHLVRPGLF